MRSIAACHLQGTSKKPSSYERRGRRREWGVGRSRKGATAERVCINSFSRNPSAVHAGSSIIWNGIGLWSIEGMLVAREMKRGPRGRNTCALSRRLNAWIDDLSVSPSIRIENTVTDTPWIARKTWFTTLIAAFSNYSFGLFRNNSGRLEAFVRFIILHSVIDTFKICGCNIIELDVSRIESTRKRSEKCLMFRLRVWHERAF